MKRIILIIILIISFYSSFVSAEIGKSIDSFKKSKFVEVFNITYDGSYLLFNSEKHKDKTAFNFKDSNNRYEIQIIANEDGCDIVYQSLAYPFTSNTAQAVRDSGLALGFVMEATSNKIDNNKFVNLIEQVAEGAKRKQSTESRTERISGYLVEVTAFYKPWIQGWSITIEK